MTLRVEQLACRRGGRLVFQGLSFQVAPGEALSVEGPNGAGKSSLLRMLAGLLRPAEGRIDNPHRLAWLGHDDALKPDRTPRAELRFWGRLDSASAGAGEDALARFNLVALADVPVRLLSAGQRRRLALARVWQSGAPLWLLDEPVTGLDADSSTLFTQACSEHLQRGGLIVASTHQDLGLDAVRNLQLVALEPDGGPSQGSSVL